MKGKPIISIVGTGYVGLTSAAVLANAGFKVFAVDVDSKKIEAIKQGRSHFFEGGLDSFVSKGVDSGNLIPTLAFEEGIPQSDIVFSCVGTPDKADGSPNLEYIYSAAESIAKNAKNGIIIVQKSTVPVGTGRKLIEHISKIAPKLQYSYVSNPEFLREGSALFDTLNMDRVVVGSDDKAALDRVVEVFTAVNDFAHSVDYSEFNDYRLNNVAKIAPFSEIPFVERTFKMRLESAELVKVSANAFLALKISFANSIAKLAEKTDADIVEVMNGVGSDFRIGRAFLYAGLGWGGGCFPKDVSGLISVAKSYGVSLPIMSAAVEENQSMVNHVVRKIKDSNGGISGMNIAVLGLSFKPGTSDVRKSQSIKLVNKLFEEGAVVKAFDPQAMEEAKESLNGNVKLTGSIAECVKDSDAVVIATDWNEFKEHDWKSEKINIRGDIFVDARNCLNARDLIEAGFEYMGIGR